MKTVRKILHYTRPQLGFYLLAIVSAIISIGLSLYIPVLVGGAVDFMIGKGSVDFPKITETVIKIAISIGIIAVTQWLMSYSANAISARATRDLRSDIFKKLNSLPLSYIDSKPRGDLISRVVNDVEAVGDGLTQVITQLFSGIVTIVGTLGFMISINFRIALVVVVLTPLSMLVAGIIGRLCARSFREQQELQGEISSYVEEIVGNQKVVKAFAYEKRGQESFEKLNKRLFKVGLKAQFAGALANPCTRFVNNMVYAATGLVGALSVISAFMGNLTIGGLSCFLTYANQYTKPFNEITGVLTQIQTALAAGERVFTLLGTDSEPDESQKKALDTAAGELEFEHVSFSYIPDKRLVLQDSWLFSGTIMENLRYGNPDATDEEIIAAAKLCYAHSFIRKMPEGYNTRVKEGGSNLSAGQKQLLCIARVMALNPPMLILDEATSSIDTLTEIRVQKAFKKLMQGRTSFVVAHRLSTIRESDTILVMRDGNIVEQGNHDELLRQRGFYYELYNSQFADS